MSILIQRHEHPGGVVRLSIRPKREPGEPFDVEPVDALGLERAVQTELAAGHMRLLFDIEQVQHVYSSALWAMVGAGVTARAAGGHAVVVSRSPYLARVLEVSSGGDSIELEPDLARGLATCAA